MFTPCPKELNRAASRRLEDRAHRHAVEKAEGGSEHGAETAPTASAIEPKHHATPPPFVAGVTVSDPGPRNRPKLCKDLKGLFTPCPR